MENQTNNNNNTKRKNSLISVTKPESIKLMKKELKSKSLIKQKQFYKNYKKNCEDDIQNSNNNFKKFESLEDFKQKLKQDEFKKKLNNFFKNNTDNKSQGVLDIQSFNTTTGKNENNTFASFYNSKENKSNNNVSLINNMNMTSKTNFFNQNINNFNRNAKNNSDNIFNLSGSNFFKTNTNFTKFNNSLKSDFPEYIPRSIRTANIELNGNPRKRNLPSADSNVSNFYNVDWNIKSSNRLSALSQINNNKNKDVVDVNLNSIKDTKIDNLIEQSPESRDEKKTNMYGESNKNSHRNKLNNFNYNNLNTSNNLGSNIINSENENLEKEINELVRCYLNSRDIDLEDENIEKFAFKKILNKFQLKSFSDPEEEKLVVDYLKQNKNILDVSNSYNSTFKKFSEIEKVCINNPNYKNPISALRKLKLNKEIYTNIMGLRKQKQIESYLDLFHDENDRILKNMQMRRVKETDLKAINSNEDIGEVINPIDLLHEKHDASTYNINRQVSRDQVLNFNLEFYASSNSEFKLKPWARSGFSLNFDGNQMIMFGGISGEILYQVWICDCKNNYNWKQMPFNEDEAPNPRYGHTAVLFKKEIFIYGGYTPADYFKPREEILIYNIGSNKFYSEKAKTFKEIEWRRNHIAHTVGSIMLVHGGVNDSGKTLNETIFLEFNTLKWNKLDTRGTRSPYLSCHCSEFVLENEKFYNNNYHIYKGTNLIENTNIIKKIEFEGIYVFGGINEEGVYKNSTYVLRVGRKPCEWIHLNIGGNPPSARANAKLNFYSNLNILILSGGKNEHIKKCIFNDIFVLDLENLNWIRAGTYPSIPKERTGHGTIIYNNQLIILGGNNVTRFLSMDFYMLDLDLYSKKYRDRERDRIKDIDIKGKSIDKGKKEDIQDNNIFK